MGNRESQAERIGQLRLEFGFPSATTIAIAAAVSLRMSNCRERG